jgi:hypothetical protein
MGHFVVVSNFGLEFSTRPITDQKTPESLAASGVAFEVGTYHNEFLVSTLIRTKQIA